MPLNLSGVLGALSPALTAATQGVAGYDQGKLQGSQLLRAMQMQDAQRSHVDAETALLTHENRTPRLGDPGYADAMAGVSGAQAGAETNARLPAEQSMATLQDRLATARQQRQQDFEAGQSARGRQQQKDMAAIDDSYRRGDITLEAAFALKRAYLEKGLGNEKDRQAAALVPELEAADGALATQPLSSGLAASAAGGTFTNRFSNPGARQYRANADRWLDAAMRIESLRGPVTPQTRAAFQSQFIPLDTDDATTQKLKAQKRAEFIQQAKTVAGPTYSLMQGGAGQTTPFAGGTPGMTGSGMPKPSPAPGATGGGSFGAFSDLVPTRTAPSGGGGSF